MGAEDRSFSDVMQNILRNVQEIVRSEVHLAKAEIQEEAGKAKSAGVLLGGGSVTAVFAAFFLLFTIYQALALVIPNWAAALIVGAILAVVATLMLAAGVQRFKRIRPAPERTVESIKENVEWARQQVK